jgi:hypothetical protein
VRCELRPQLGEIQNRIDLAQQVIGGDALLEIKPVEKPSLRSRTLSHHRHLHRFAHNQWNHASKPATNAEFFNKIGEFLPLPVIARNGGNAPHHQTFSSPSD